jgi:hypothetical protein
VEFNERKRKVENLLHIKFPTSWAPPPIPVLRSGGGGSYVNHREDAERHSRMMEAIEAERRELMKMPDAELDAAYTEATRQAQERARLKAELEERSRFFHQPNASADFVYWSKVEYWTLDESLALLLGKSPEAVTWKTVQAYVNISEFAKRYERLRNLALRAHAMNRGQTAIYPSAVLAWAADMDIAVPPGLQGAMAERDAKKRAAAASREEAKRLHDFLLGEGVLEAFKVQPVQPDVSPMQAPPMPTRPEASEAEAAQEAQAASEAEQPETAETSTQAAVVHTTATRRDVSAPVGSTWLDKVRGYVVEFQRQGNYRSAKTLFSALECATGEDGSPFEKGSGTDRGKLVIRATGVAVAGKTLSNRWQEIRREAAL